MTGRHCDNKRWQAEIAGTDFLVLLIPTKELVFEEEEEEEEEAGYPKSATQFYSELLHYEHQMWQTTKAFLNKHGIAFVDALPALKQRLKRGQQPYQVSSDGHPNAIGQRAIAELVKTVLMKRGLPTTEDHEQATREKKPRGIE